jgi:TetR/AcrR family transcriptional regulator
MADKIKENTIINAARERFAHFGFSKVTMEEIAADVELGKASLYYYFPTKEDLFKAVILMEQNELKNTIDILLTRHFKASQKLQEYVEQRLKFFQGLINLGALSVQSYFDIKPVFKKLFMDFESVELSLIRKIIEEGKKSNEFDPDISDETSVVFLHVLQGLRLRTLRWNKGQRLKEEDYSHLKKEMKTATDIFIRGIKK